MAFEDQQTIFKEFRAQVPLVANTNIVYLNSSYQSPMNKIVTKCIENYVSQGLNEPEPKPKWVEECENVRLKVANFIKARPDDIVFTRDATEACNLFQRSLKFQKGANVVLLKGEHPSQTAGWLGLVSDGLDVKFVDVDETKPYSYNAETFSDSVDENTIAIGISSVMFHSGVRNNIKSICEAYRPKGIHVLVDGTQEIGFGNINVKELGVSALGCSIHKGLSCPTGLGLLYIDPSVLPYLRETPPIMTASSLSNIPSSLIIPNTFKFFSSAKKFEHLNKALLQCLTLGVYLDYIDSVDIRNIQNFLENLGVYLRSQLKEINVQVIGPDERHLRSPQSNVLALESPEWKRFFSENNVYISQGRCGVRVSFGIYNTQEDIDKFIAIVKKGLDLGLK